MDYATITGDLISDLPKVKTQADPEDKRVVNSIFGSGNGGGKKSLVVHMRGVVIILALFILFSVPQFDKILLKVLPFTRKSPYILIIIKSILFALIYWLISYFYLSKL